MNLLVKDRFHSALNPELLAYANMNDANLSGANVLGANMYCVDLRGANLEGLLGWRGAFWVVANLHNVRNAPHGFVEWAISEAGAVSLEDDKRWTDDLPPSMCPHPELGCGC